MNAYAFSFKDSNGKTLPLSHFKGEVLLIVNTASNCGFTKQYAGLEKLYQKYKSYGLTIIAVPSNDFGNQEPGSDDQIHQFCSLNYCPSFPIVKKEHVRGKEAHPFYKWAKNKFGFWAAPKWNFHKYLLDREGKLVDYFYSTTPPENHRIASAIEKVI